MRHSQFSRNTIFLSASTIGLGLGGLVFWILGSRAYGTADVGVAITVTAALSLLTSITSAGWPQLGMRDGATNSRSAEILRRSAFGCAFIGAPAVAIIAVTPGHFGIAIDGLGATVAPVVSIALVTVLSGSVGSCLEGVLVARRAAHFVLLDSALGVAARLVALFLLIDLGGTGLLLANAVGCAVSAVSAYVFLRFLTVGDLMHSPTVSLRQDAAFAVATGVPNVIALAPLTLLPTVVLNTLGAESATYFTVSLSIASAVRLIPAVMSQTLLAEAGRGADPRRLLGRALKAASAISSVICVVVIAGAGPITELYGEQVSQSAARVLTLLVVSGLLSGANYLLDSMLLALGHTIRYSVVNVLGSIIVFGLVATGAQFGLEFAAIGYILAEIVYGAVGWSALSTASGWRSNARKFLSVTPPPEHANSALSPFT